MIRGKERSLLRIALGTLYYRAVRYWYWYFCRIDFARTIESNQLPIEIFSHQTVLLRELDNVDMWMQHNKIQNLKIAIQKINGLVINPGQTFSYWRQIGNPTARKGYLQGMVLDRGRVTSGVGGGLCQLSNLLYWMTLYTPLTVRERWRHAYDVFPDAQRSQPFGTGATCAYPNIDLQIRNDTAQRFQLSLCLTPTHLVGTWCSDAPSEYAYEVVEKDHAFTGQWDGGYTRGNKIFRKVFDRITGAELREEFITENSATTMYNPLLPPGIQGL